MKYWKVWEEVPRSVIQFIVTQGAMYEHVNDFIILISSDITGYSKNNNISIYGHYKFFLFHAFSMTITVIPE